VAARLEIVSGDLQTDTVVREVAPLVVRVLDDRGRPMAGQVVSFVPAVGDGAPLVDSDTTDAAGRAEGRWILGAAAGDTMRLDARLAGSADAALRVTFRAVGTPDRPVHLGDDYPWPTVPAAGATLHAITFRITDAWGNPTPGVPSTWAVLDGGGTLAADAATRADGTTRGVWTLGATPGRNTLRVEVGGMAAQIGLDAVGAGAARRR
jgi:hypothetical protein